MDPEAIGYWTLFACAASRVIPRGSLPNDLDELSLMIHRPTEDIERMIGALLENGLLERRSDGRIWFYKWAEYQPPSTDRANKSRDAKRGETESSKSNKSNTAQHSATSATSGSACNARGEERRREETPLPPEGAVGVCVSRNGSEPEEPFIPTPSEVAPPPLPPETLRMVHAVDEILPGLGYGMLCGQQGWDPDCAIGAAVELKVSEKTEWSYFRGIYRRQVKDKAAGKPPPKPRKPAPVLECDRPFRAPRPEAKP